MLNKSNQHINIVRSYEKLFMLLSCHTTVVKLLVCMKTPRFFVCLFLLKTRLCSFLTTLQQLDETLFYNMLLCVMLKVLQNKYWLGKQLFWAGFKGICLSFAKFCQI